MNAKKPVANGKAGGSFFGVLAGTYDLICRRIAQPPVLIEFPRLLTEGIAPLRRLVMVARNHQEICGFLDSGRDVNFISSFFRSGNTWTRFLLADVILQNRGVETSTAAASEAAKIAPDVYAGRIAWRNVMPAEPALVKTHETFETVRRCVIGNNGRSAEKTGVKGKVRALYLYRRPEDVLVSYYHYRLLSSPTVSRWFDIESFCRSEFPAWVRHVSSYLRGADDGTDIFFMSYEKLLGTPVEALGLMLRWLNIDPTVANIERAVANMQFDKLRAMEESYSKKAGERFFRNGKANTGADELSPDTVKWIRDSSALILEQLEQRAAGCQSEQGRSVTIARNVGERGMGAGFAQTPSRI